MPIIGDSSITAILSSDDVTAEFINGPSEDLKGHIDTLNVHHDGALTHDGDLSVTGNLSAGDLALSGDLTVGGTTTTLNTATLDVEDVNITINKGGNQATADDTAGLTVEMSDATNASIIYDKDVT